MAVAWTPHLLPLALRFLGHVSFRDAETSVDRLRRSLAQGRSLSDAWMNDRYEWAAELLDRLDRSDPEILSTIRIAGCKEGEVKKELRNLMRSGSKTSEN